MVGDDDVLQTGYNSSLVSNKAILMSAPRKKFQIPSPVQETVKFMSSDHSKFTSYPEGQNHMAFSSISAAFDDRLVESIKKQAVR